MTPEQQSASPPADTAGTATAVRTPAVTPGMTPAMTSAGVEPGMQVEAGTVTIDCDTCSMRDIACGDCVVTVILGRPPMLELDQEESAALTALANGGLVPHLRLVANG